MNSREWRNGKENETNLLLGSIYSRAYLASMTRGMVHGFCAFNFLKSCILLIRCTYFPYRVTKSATSHKVCHMLVFLAVELRGLL